MEKPLLSSQRVVILKAFRNVGSRFTGSFGFKMSEGCQESIDEINSTFASTAAVAENLFYSTAYPVIIVHCVLYKLLVYNSASTV
ncbi:hypothetical protein RB195_017054 [Necator americanus]|uniref:Uncharacterized protein n=1 Tax=Necator americanus TaxID=51031 RepID=A0ABR1C3D4_NECAM